MDTKKRFTPISYTLQTIPSALLLIGDKKEIKSQAESLLMTMLCSSNNCGVCTTCVQIRDKQHQAFLWLCPEKGYTVDSLDDLFSIIAFSLGNNRHFFFILEKAELLNSATAHKLLKPIEEPPPGYHFILLAENANSVLPTIRSRCTMHNLLQNNQAYQTHPLFTCFTTHPVTAAEFQIMIDKLKIDEYETKNLIEVITEYWVKKQREKILNNEQQDPTIEHIVTALLKAQKKLPMPGSSALFWKNMYLMLNYLPDQKT